MAGNAADVIVAGVRSGTTSSDATSMNFNVLDHGALGDGRTLDTAALQAAIDTAHAAGGSVVVVPPGRYLTGTIFLRDRVTLDLQAGATLLGSADLADYRAVPGAKAPGSDRSPYHLIVARGVAHVGLTGGGAIDGQGQAFWLPPESADAWIRTKEPRPSPMIEFVDCRDVRIDGVHLANPAGWTLHFFDCDRVLVRGVSIRNDPRSPNSDGIDITGCRDVTIDGCQIETGDDAIVLKSLDRTVERVTVTNCRLRSQCAGLKLGTNESRSDMCQILFANNIVTASHRGVYLSSVEGAALEDIVVDNLIFDSRVPVVLPRPIHLDLRRRHDESPRGAIRHVTISNVIARTNGRILLTAEDGSWLEDILLRDVQLVYPLIEDPCLYAPRATGAQFSNRSPAAREACAAVVADNVRNLAIENLAIAWPEGPVPDEWRIPVKRENGGSRVFHPDYANARPVGFGVVWGRNLEGGYLRAPLAHASDAEAPRLRLEGGSFRELI